ncbi:lipoprotein localization factor LolB, partial [Pseudomonas carnis]|nr:lipoprotein localization factor LolB [Pseudomonas carnis]
MFLRHVIVFSFIALLAGCAGIGSRESVEGQGNPVQWKQHKDQLSSIDGWQIEGKVGV